MSKVQVVLLVTVNVICAIVVATVSKQKLKRAIRCLMFVDFGVEKRFEICGR